MSLINRKRSRGGPRRAGSRRATTRVAVVVASLMAAVAVAACGSSSGTATGAASAANASSSSSSSSQAAARQKFAACLKQHGVTLPSRPNRAGGNGPGTGAGGGYGPPAGGQRPGTGTTGGPYGGRSGAPFFGGGARNSKFAKAFKACAKYRPNFPGRGNGQGRPRFSTKALDAFVTCVRKHGYPQMPNPKRTSTGGFFPKSIESNPKFKAAAAKCQSVLRQALQQARAGSGGKAPTSTTGSASQQT